MLPDFRGYCGARVITTETRDSTGPRNKPAGERGPLGSKLSPNTGGKLSAKGKEGDPTLSYTKYKTTLKWIKDFSSI